MRETRSSGSVEGVVSNHDPYSDYILDIFVDFLLLRFDFQFAGHLAITHDFSRFRLNCSLLFV